MSAHPVHIRLALFAGIALLVGGPAGALQLQMLGGAPEYFRTGDAYSSDEQRSAAEKRFEEHREVPRLPPSSAFDGPFQRVPGGVAFAPPTPMFAGSPTPGFGGPGFPSFEPPKFGKGPQVQELIADLPAEEPVLEDETPVVYSDEPLPGDQTAPAPVPLPSALPLFATVIAGLFALPRRRRG